MKKLFLVVFFFMVLVPFQVNAFDVTLAWDASTSGDVKDYIIHYDTFSGEGKTGSKNVGGAVTGTVLGLPNMMHYFHITCTDWEGRFSGPSNEVRTDGVDVPGDTGEDPVAPGGCYVVTVTPDP